MLIALISARRFAMAVGAILVKFWYRIVCGEHPGSFNDVAKLAVATLADYFDPRAADFSIDDGMIPALAEPYSFNWKPFPREDLKMKLILPSGVLSECPAPPIRGTVGEFVRASNPLGGFRGCSPGKPSLWSPIAVP